MAVYNGERYLREAINSILDQTFRDFEFVIIDDGSSDGTQDILRSYDDPRIQVLVNERNIGLTRSLNRGLKRARGEFIARQDADDISEPKRFERQVAFLDAQPEVALLGTSYTLMHPQGTCHERIRLPCDHLELCWELFIYCPFVHSAVMIRREPLFNHVGLYDEKYAYSQDYDLWCRIADCLRVANLSEFLVRYRMHPGSMTSTYSHANSEFRGQRLARIARRLGWNEQDLAGRELLPDVITALYQGWPRSYEPAVLRQAAYALLDLHRVFSSWGGIHPDAARKHERALRTRISRNLVMLTVFCRSENLATRAKLLAHAWAVSRRSILHPRTLLRVGRAFAGTYIPYLRTAPATAGGPAS